MTFSNVRLDRVRVGIYQDLKANPQDLEPSAVDCLKHRLLRLADDLGAPRVGVGIKSIHLLRFDLFGQLWWGLLVVV